MAKQYTYPLQAGSLLTTGLPNATKLLDGVSALKDANAFIFTCLNDTQKMPCEVIAEFMKAYISNNSSLPYEEQSAS